MILKGKKAIITGASRGIGLAIAKNLAEQGVDLYVTARDNDLLKKARNELSRFEINVGYISADLSDQEDIKKVFNSAIEFLGGLDILINNAGLGVKGDLIEQKPEDWNLMFDLNVRAVFLLSQMAAKVMVKQKSGYIINIGSGASNTPIASYSGYCATKYALLGFSESIGLELRNHNVKVSIVLPGSTATYFGGGEPSDRIAAKPGILRYDDVANSVLYLLKQSDIAWTSIVNLRPLNPDKYPSDE
jgi:3-oxoacyl-[acyl-carrier protein] reductase